MASILDMTFFSNFGVIFTFLFVYVMVYGLAEFSKPFGKDKKSLNALMALTIAIVVVISPSMTRLITYLIPWFFTISLILFFILFALKVFSGDKFDFTNVVKEKRVYTWIIVLTVVIMIFSLGNAFGQDSLDQGNWDGTSAVDNSSSQTSDSGESDASGLKNTAVDGSSVATDDFGTNMVNTIFNPKVLGLMLIMLVGVFAMFFLSD